MALPEPAADVVARVSALAAASSRPTLTAEEVKAAIQANPRVDRDGLEADLEGWDPTWDIYRAVSELWGLKAGKVAGDFDFSADDATYSKGDVMAKCLEMEAHYAAKVSGSMDTGGYDDFDPLHGVVVNG